MWYFKSSVCQCNDLSVEGLHTETVVTAYTSQIILLDFKKLLYIGHLENDFSPQGLGFGTDRLHMVDKVAQVYLGVYSIFLCQSSLHQCYTYIIRNHRP
jgi:hypothetical protein